MQCCSANPKAAVCTDTFATIDVIFNAGSIAFPLSRFNSLTLKAVHAAVLMLKSRAVGFYARIWWLDALGGLILSLVVIFNWSQTSFEHIRHLTGFSATADQRNIREFGQDRIVPPVRLVSNLSQCST